MARKKAPELNALITAFLAQEKTKCSAQGFLAITSLMRSVQIWLVEEDLEVTEVDIGQAMNFQRHLATRLSGQGTPLAPGTVNNHLKAARRFFDWLVIQGVMKTDPFRDLVRLRVPQRITNNLLTQEQMGLLLGELSRFDREPRWYDKLRHYRVHVAVELMYSAGLNVLQAAAVEPADLDLKARTVSVRTTRHGKPRVAFLSDYAAGVLARYLEHRELVFGSHGRTHGHTLFGTALTRLGWLVNEVLETLCNRLKLPVITSYGLRNSLGVHLVQSGCDLRHVQLLVGFTNLGSTRSYLKHLKDHLRAVVDKAHPRASWGKSS